MNDQMYLPRTLKEVRAARETAEAEILAILRDLTGFSGLDLAKVEVMTVVDAVEINSDPRRRPIAVRIDLAV